MATNATQLGGLAANQYAQTSDSRLSDSRVPTAGSPAYIQNTNSQQTANFNINGNGTAGGTMSANIVNAATQINLNGTRVLHAPGTGNLFAGASAGAANTTGQRNSFFGALAGLANTGGNDNAFFGNNAGQLNTGTDNSFFGSGSGAGNVSGIFNSFFGKDAGGGLNQNGSQNSFFGHKAGAKNSASDNAFFGASAGAANTVGGPIPSSARAPAYTIRTVVTTSTWEHLPATQVRRVLPISLWGATPPWRSRTVTTTR
jgi:hypothetical protein